MNDGSGFCMCDKMIASDEYGAIRCTHPRGHSGSCTEDGFALLVAERDRLRDAAQKLVEAYEASRFTLMPRLEYEELRALLAVLDGGEKP